MAGSDENDARQFIDRVHRVEFDMEWPPGHVAAYLIEGDEPVLVDAGPAGDTARDELESGLAQAGYDLADVAHLVVTHPHSDHVGSLTAVLDAADPLLYAPAGVRERLSRPIEDFVAAIEATATEAGLPDDEVEHAVKESAWLLKRRREQLPAEAIDAVLDDRERVAIADFEVEPIHTPGHQAEHMCLRVPFEGTDVLFSGDVLFATFRAAAFDVGIEEAAYGAIGRFYGSLDTLADLRVTRTFPGHGPVFDEYDVAIESARADLDDLVTAVEGEVESRDVVTPYEVAAGRAGSRRLRSVLLETLGALGHLTDRRRVAFEVEDGVRRYRAVG